MSHQLPTLGPRNRSYGGTVASGLNRKFYDHNGVLYQTDTNLQYGNRQGEVGEMFDITVADYRKRVASGELINNPMNRRVTVRQPCNGPWTVFNSNGSRVEFSGSDTLGVLGFVLPPIDHSTGFGPNFGQDDTALQYEATIKALSRVNQPDTLVLVSIAEVRKTTSMITNTCGSLASAIGALASGRPKAAILNMLGVKPRRKSDTRFAGKTIRDKWLEMRYGWTPLLYDLEGTMNALSRIRYVRNTARGFSAMDRTLESSGSVSIDPSFGHSCTALTSENRTVSVRAYVLYRADEAWYLPNRLGALAPLETVWELVPFSFVVDWFVDVGGWLRAITPRIGVKTLVQGTVTRIGYSWNKSVTATTSGPGSSISGMVGLKASYNAKTVHRITTADLPILPPIDVNINVKRALDAIALLGQQARRIRN